MSDLRFIDAKPPQPIVAWESSPRVAFVTLGCKVNQSDTQKAISDFRAAGFRIVPSSSPAEVYVVNTCSVTHVADRKSRQWLRRAARANPAALVVATGCYAASGKAALDDMPEVGLVVGYKGKESLLSLVLERMPGYTPSAFVATKKPGQPRTPTWAGNEEGEIDPSFASRTRAMVKIEDGCNDFCTFCIIPFTRGMPRSTPANEVVRLVRQRLDEGYKEIVLTGVHMGKYGKDHAQRKRVNLDPDEAADLPGVVRAVLERTAVPRLRITSVEPTDAVMMLPILSDARYKGRVAPHLHLPLQSGCDATLARMKRDYTTAEYAVVVRECREAVPGISITTDLIAGFPGETEAEWKQTMQFVADMRFASLHVFPYSQRPGTPAEQMPCQVSPKMRHTRTLQAIELGSRAEAACAIRYLGATLPVLWERASDGVWSGLTDNYIRVYSRAGGNLRNVITPALITAFDAHGLWAEPLCEPGESYGE
ncbi:MAG: tRNA (N(6)-L-threonylcarbamoyladenosine(37)-C(2))-methylthiotransferase MtaB [Chloroflexi bacterium]|nr:tRNA (N(6)-L-threonylcarbamoyladenosine(37)-C(2))-methylthiotransferase MtaB [Chloroflexota bacterium]